MQKNLAALFLLYVRPVSALGQILDQGRLWFSVVAAVAVSWLLHSSDQIAQFGPPAGPPDGPPPGFAAVIALRILSLAPGSWLFPLAVIAILLVPALILIRAVSGFGSFGVLMESDYLGLLNCVLMSWAAAFLPFALAGFFVDSEVLHTLPVFLVANFYFVALAALGVRTVFGTGLGPAAGMTLGACGAAFVGGGVFSAVGGSLGFLMSPFVLYYAYLMLGSDVRSLGQGLRSRQHLREQLEIATNNPRDADAHYQLGLIHQKRRQYSEAIARFTQAIEIDPSETDAHFQLGHIAREQGRFDDAIRFLQTAAAQDDKFSSSDVWRELGAAYLGASRIQEAEAALAKYTDRRGYDPEGLYWYGKILIVLNRPAEAREMFARAIEAAKTMPRHRRAEVRKWGSLARAELSALKRAV
jgi:Flp pilus assembly protein TadD